MDVVLVHSGVTDSREWDGVRALLEPPHRTVTADLWQSRPVVDIVLDAIPGEHAALVGTSFGGRAALEAAASAPERIDALVVIGTNPFGWSDEVRAIGAQEEKLYNEGRLDDAAGLMVGAWLVGPHRSEEDVPRELRELAFGMQRRIYELDEPQAGPLDPDDVRVRMLFVRGELDWPDVERAAQRFPHAEQAVVEGAAHLVTLERPGEVARLVGAFLET
jgi:3-oxoadipate enol-lactonase